MVTKRVLKKCFQDAQDLNYGSYPGILTPRTKRSIEICDVSKLSLHRSQNKQINSDSVLQFQMQYRLISLVRRISGFIQPRAVSVFLFSLVSVSRTYIHACNRSL